MNIKKLQDKHNALKKRRTKNAKNLSKFFLIQGYGVDAKLNHNGIRTYQKRRSPMFGEIK